MAADIAYLASEHLEGRAVGSPGGDTAAVFLADRYAQLGVGGGFGNACSPRTACGAAYLQVFRAAGAQAENVVAMVEGRDPTLRGQYVIVGAHYDHLGRSTRGALDPERGRVLRVGADDNASGTAALLELGRRFATNPAPMTVVFAHFDAEELGLFGSAEFVDNAPMPLDSIVLMLNFDMVGRLRAGPLIAEATAGTDSFRELLQKAASEQNVPLEFAQITRGQTDHLSFARRGIPSVALFTGFHQDYHRATDTADRIDLVGLLRIVDLTEDVVRGVGTDQRRTGGGGFR
jgi:Zn-dependent M28 family amino/carboxypeptidase